MDPLLQVSQRAEELLIPLSVHLDLTYRCHQRCVHCYLPAGWRRGQGPGPELDTRQIKGILDQLAEMGTFFLSLSGGEIFLRPDIFEIVEYARRQNFAVSLTTTGTYGLESEQIRALADVGIERVLVSVYSLNDHVHDTITGRPGSLARAMATIRGCKDAGILVGMNCLVFGLNYEHFKEVITLGLEEGIGLRIDERLTPRWDGQPYPENFILDATSLHAVMDYIREADVREPASVSHPDKYACIAGVSGCYISPQGVVRPCIDTPWICGDLARGDEFHQVWSDSAMLHHIRQVQEEFASTEKRLCDSDMVNQGFAIKCHKFGG
jgi:AdoMet-dependent heme synthase